MVTNNQLNPVLLPVIRRVMPNIIAHQIVGVQPMTGPVGSIFSMRPGFVNRTLTGEVHVPVIKPYRWKHTWINTNILGEMTRFLGYNIDDKINNQRRNAGNRPPRYEVVGHAIRRRTGKAK